MKYIYIPFQLETNHELHTCANNWRNSIQNFTDETPPKKIAYPTNLEVLREGDTLYILAHGDFENCIIYNHGVMFPDRMTLSPQELTAQLINQNLPNTQLNIKIFACNSGRAPIGRRSFGEYFYHSLIANGYNNIIVTAYLVPLVQGGLISLNFPHKNTGFVNEDRAAKSRPHPSQEELTNALNNPNDDAINRFRPSRNSIRFPGGILFNQRHGEGVTIPLAGNQNVPIQDQVL